MAAFCALNAGLYGASAARLQVCGWRCSCRTACVGMQPAVGCGSAPLNVQAPAPGYYSPSAEPVYARRVCRPGLQATMLGTLAVWWGVSALGFFVACFPFLTGAHAVALPQALRHAWPRCRDRRRTCLRCLEQVPGTVLWCTLAVPVWCCTPIDCRARACNPAHRTSAVVGFTGGLARPFGASLAAVFAFLPFKVG